ncbi:MAG: hypothetical protein CVT74_13550, partial [Alphaproteobacteria bacterium HGW-Alphaproteobacteria-13]
MENREISVRRTGLTMRTMLLATAMCAVGSVPAMAQDGDQSEQAVAATGGEIVVTALKRGTRLQDTP